MSGGVAAVAALSAVVMAFATMQRYWLAAIPVVLFLVPLILRRDFGSAPGLAAWLLYGLWEFTIQHRITCDAECNIRVDVFLTLPLVVTFTMLSARRLLPRRNERGL